MPDQDCDILSFIEQCLSERATPATFELDVLDAHLVNDLLLDSLDILELHFRLEEEFGVVVDDVDATGLNVVRDLVSYVQRRRAA